MESTTSTRRVDPEELARTLASLAEGEETIAIEEAAKGPLAEALWLLVRGDQGQLVARHRSLLRLLRHAPFSSNDFLLLLRGLEAEHPDWYRNDGAPKEGLGYAGWDAQLEGLLRSLRDRGEDLTEVAAAEFVEPIHSALRFAVGRGGLSVKMQSEALRVLARAFLLRATSCPEQFEGWEHVFPLEVFARAVWSQVGDVTKIEAKCAVLTPLVPFASGKEIASATSKLLWPEPVILEWRRAHRAEITKSRESAEVERLLAHTGRAPNELRALAEAISTRPADESDRVAGVLAPLFQRPPHYTWRLEEALQQLTMGDFLATLRFTAGRMENRRQVEALCRHFVGAEGLPLAAANWWCNDPGDPCASALVEVLGESVVGPLLQRTGKDRASVVAWLVSVHPMAALEHLTPDLVDDRVERSITSGLTHALQTRVEGIEEQIRRLLGGPFRKQVLRALASEPRSELLTALEALDDAVLDSEERTQRKAALEATVFVASRRERSGRALLLKRIAHISEPVQALWLAAGGRVLAAETKAAVHLSCDEQRVVIPKRNLEDDTVVLSDDGEWLLLADETDDDGESGYAVLRPFEGTRPLHLLTADDAQLASVIPLPGGRAMTVSAVTHSSSGNVELWDLASGRRTKHPRVDVGALIAIVDDEHYVVVENGKGAVRKLATGKRLLSLPTTRDEEKGEDGDDFVTAVAVGDGGSVVAGLHEDGWLRIWHLAGKKTAIRHEDVALAPQATCMLADSASSWIAAVTPAGIRLVHAGATVPGLPSTGGERLAFWRPGVLVVAGDVLDVWDLSHGHVGSIDRSITAMATGGGKLLVATEDGTIWEVATPSTP